MRPAAQYLALLYMLSNFEKSQTEKLTKCGDFLTMPFSSAQFLKIILLKKQKQVANSYLLLLDVLALTYILFLDKNENYFHYQTMLTCYHCISLFFLLLSSQK